MTRRLLLVPAAVLVLSACSGDGGSPDQDVPSAQEVREAYVEQAGAVCEKADADFSALAPPTAPADFGPYVRETVRIAETAQRELTALAPPEPDRAELESKLLTPLAAFVEDGKAFAAKVAAAATDQAKLLPLLSQRPTPTGVDLQFLRSYGLDVCADALSQAG